jgi:alpha-N-arabinofuranosidase
MDKFDPDKRVGMIIDEWGNWYEVEPGTNRGFLYQQNTLRDALSAGLTLNIFNSYCDRVQMANLAQTVNVLQALVLTDEEKMIVTPTYHVFDMYQVHQDAVLLPIELQGRPYKHGEEEIVGLSVSASLSEDGSIHVSLCNLDPKQDAPVDIDLKGVKVTGVTGRILTAEVMNAHNTFEDPDAIFPVPFDAVRLQGGRVTAVLPSKSVVLLTIK